MTEREARERLQRLIKIDQRINSLIADKERLYSSLYKSPSFSQMPRTTSPDVHRIEKIYNKLAERERRILKEIDRLVDEKEKVSLILEKMENHTSATILRYRYIMMMSWKEIAKDMNYSIQRLYELHNKSIKDFAKEQSKTE